MAVHFLVILNGYSSGSFLSSIGNNYFHHRMASNRGQGGIQQLLAAEHEARQIVNAAKNEKLARLKQAKEEAEKEISEYRGQVEYEFQKKLAESSGDSGANVKRLEQETESKISHLKTEAERISQDVVSMLLKHVTTVRN
ncbi:V-type proton ATPase subunit G isoform X1 [Neltuma alba]|uniref:V-type proton ATPase subunit G isoform X1 n=2 Tax=Neltuma alba TaxID=207710 RepID=UPI0010A2CCC4|nr:V-type proton ATPase subunit G-like isoform X1 [Prosopis alba]